MRAALCFFLHCFYLLCAVFAGAAQAEPASVRIIAFNDLHGNLDTPEPVPTSGGLLALGGIDALAAQIDALERENPRSVVVSAGDLIGASPLLSAWFHDEPTIELANRLPLDFAAVGNHEFDEGLAELLRLQRGGCHPDDPEHSCAGARVGTPQPFEGARFPFLAANVFDVRGQRVLPAYGIATIGGVKIGFIGVTLRETATLLAPAAARDVAFGDEAMAINAQVPELRARGASVIVALIHQGGRQSAGAETDIDGCAGGLAGSPLQRIVERLDDAVDVVVSGHTHAAYICRLRNAAGRPVPATSAGHYGRLLTVIDLSIDSAGRVVDVAARNRLVARDAVAAPRNSAVDTLLANYRALLGPLERRRVGAIGAAIATRRDAACSMPAGALAADAQWHATRAVERGGAQFALVNPGGVRAPGLPFEPGGAVTFGAAFAMQPFGNALVTLALRGDQLKGLLEQQFAGCEGQSLNRVLQPSANFRFAWDGTRPLCDRIVRMTLNGTTVVPQAMYRVTVNDFLASGGDDFSVLLRGRNPIGGRSELDALVDYLAGFDPLRGGLPYAPTLAVTAPRIERIDPATDCP